jgi:hypothetical protein
MMAFVAQVKSSGMSMDDFLSKLQGGDIEGLKGLAVATGADAAAATSDDAGSSSSSGGEAPMTPEQVLVENKRLLVDFYQEHDPEKVGTVDKILGAWKTKKLTNALMKKYGQAPPFVGCSISMGLGADAVVSPTKAGGDASNPLSPTLSTPGASPAQPAAAASPVAATEASPAAAAAVASPEAAAAAAAASPEAAAASPAATAAAAEAAPSPRSRAQSLPPSKLGGLFGGGGASPKKAAASPAAVAAAAVAAVAADGEKAPAEEEKKEEEGGGMQSVAAALASKFAARDQALQADAPAAEAEPAAEAADDKKAPAEEEKKEEGGGGMQSIAASLTNAFAARNRALSMVTEEEEEGEEEGEEQKEGDKMDAEKAKEVKDATIGAEAAEKAKKEEDDNKAAEAAEAKKAEDAAPKVAVKDLPDYAPYFKMLKMGLPKGAVKHKMQKDGKDPEVLNLDPNQPLPTPKKKEKKPSKPKNTIPVKDLPDYAPYFKMLKMGLPKGAVKHKMQKDDKDPAVLDMDPNKPLPDEPEEGEEEEEEEPEDTGPKIPIKDMPEVQQYLKMLKMGLPKGAVRQKMIKDGKVNPDLLDMDPNKPPEAKKKKKKSMKGMLKNVAMKVKEKLVRRKKLHWSAVEDDDIDIENSVWGQIGNEEGSMGGLADFDIGMDELNSLFTATNSPPKARSSKPAAKKASGKVQLLEGKRTMNMEIALKSFKTVDKVTGKGTVMPYSVIREIIETLDGTKLTLDQVQGLEECMPSSEDKVKLGRFNGDKTKLGEAEKVGVLPPRCIHRTLAALLLCMFS